MKQVSVFPKTRAVGIAVVCTVAISALAISLLATGIIGATEAAGIILALYIGSKIFMGSIALWLGIQHAEKIRAIVRRYFSGSPFIH